MVDTIYLYCFNNKSPLLLLVARLQSLCMAKILHIEDNPENLLLVRRLLESAGHTVVEALDGLSGIRAAGEDIPDLILMDINLPGLDGNEATTIIKSTPGLPNIPIVAITSNAFPGSRERCLVAGCDGYIPKPIDVDTFVSTLNAYLAGYRDDLPLEKKAHYLGEYSRELAVSLEEQAYARHFLEGIIMQSPVSTLITDKDGVCVLHNNVYAKVFNVEQERSIGAYRIFDDPQLRKNGRLDIIRMVFEENHQAEFQTNYYIPGKGERIIRFSVFPVLDSSGMLKNTVVQHMDITDEIKAVKEQEILRNQLFQAQKMESIGTLAGGVAHDYNNLLVGVLGGAELLLKNMDVNDSKYKLLCIIRDSALKMSDLTKSLLAYAQGGKFLPEEIDINQFVEETLAFTSRIIDRQITVTSNLQPGLPMIVADRGQFHQTLINIIMNAAEATEGKGEIIITTKLAEFIPESFTDADPDGVYVSIIVQDTGCGMSQSVLEKVFEPFYSTKGTGRGLGMAAIYGITRQHKAMIQAKSEPNIGTKIELIWPTNMQFPVEKTSEPHPGEGRKQPQPPTGSILIVDDEEVVREVATDILSGSGYSVLIAEDGDDAIEAVKANPDINLVILDIIMKRMNGKETYVELKKLKPEIKVLVSSGYDEDSPVRDILDMGAEGFIQKPYNLDELLSRVNSILDKS